MAESFYQQAYGQMRADVSRTRGQMHFSGEKPSGILYLVVGMFALLKDLIDITFGMIPGIGIAISLVLGTGFAITMFLLLTIFDRSGAGSRKNQAIAKQLVRRLLVFIGVLFVEILPLISFFPLTTISIVILYSIARRDWKKSQKEQRRGLRQTQGMLYAG